MSSIKRTLEIESNKQSLTLHTPVIGAPGAFGFATEYSRVIDLSKLGAIVTNPLTLKGRTSAAGMHVAAIDSGVVLHTGLPNAGLRRAHREYAPRWKNSPCPIILCLAADNETEITELCMQADQIDEISGVYLMLRDDFAMREIRGYVAAARMGTQLPLLVELPFLTAMQATNAAVEGGADALVVSGTPRGSAREPATGKIMPGRVYAPWVKAINLRAVAQIAPRVNIPVIAAGGIFNPYDARDYIEVGAKAVQLDAVVWIRPSMVEIIARDLGGLEYTRPSGALADEWYPGFGETAAQRAALFPSPVIDEHDLIQSDEPPYLPD